MSGDIEIPNLFVLTIGVRLVGAVVSASRELKSLAPANLHHGYQACTLRSEALRPFLVAGLFIRSHLVLIYSFNHVLINSIFQCDETHMKANCGRELV